MQKPLFPGCWFILPVLLLISGWAQADWELKSDKDGVQVFTRAVEGSAFKQVKLIAEFPGNRNAVLKAFGDGSVCADWVALCVESNVLEKIDDGEYIARAILNFPWPFANRDVVFRRRTTDLDDGTLRITQFPEADYLPKQKQVRMLSENTYDFSSVDDNRLKMIWINHSNPGPGVPKGVFNGRIHKDLRKDLIALRELLENGT